MPDQPKPRARDLGVVVGLLPPGPNNAITDVKGVRVGHTTLIHGDGPLRVGKGPVRTGVTVVVPPLEPGDALFGGYHSLNGNGEMTGTIWLARVGPADDAHRHHQHAQRGRRARRDRGG